jgi:hypothetical protein
VRRRLFGQRLWLWIWLRFRLRFGFRFGFRLFGRVDHQSGWIRFAGYGDVSFTEPIGRRLGDH